MPSNEKLLEDFVDKIPDNKLEGLPTKPRTIWGKAVKQSQYFRLDMQGMTSNEDPPRHNLQIQVNSRPMISSLRQYVPNSVVRPTLVPSGKSEPGTAWIKEELKKNIDLSQAYRRSSKPGQAKASKTGESSRSGQRK